MEVKSIDILRKKSNENSATFVFYFLTFLLIFGKLLFLNIICHSKCCNCFPIFLVKRLVQGAENRRAQGLLQGLSFCLYFCHYYAAVVYIMAV